MPFRDTPSASGSDTVAQRYENTMSRLQRITQAGYQVKVQWECEFVPPEDIEVVESKPTHENQRCTVWRTYRDHASTLERKGR